jgi:hypothetical protein
MSTDIRWQQRFSNFRQALAQLETFFEPPALNEREQQGLIKAFVAVWLPGDGPAWAGLGYRSVPGGPSPGPIKSCPIPLIGAIPGR